MSSLRRAIRLPLVFLHVFHGALCLRLAIAWDRLRGHRLHEGLARRVQVRWSRRLCGILGIRIRVEGELGSGPAMLVSNHVSWIDIPVMAAVCPAGFLSKSEVRGWPVVGPVATGLGTLYIERGRQNAAARAAEALRQRLAEGHRVLFFPEGTTSDGRRLLPFRPRLYQAALDAGAPVQVLAISYHGPDGDLDLVAPFIDDDPLLAHLLRLTRVPRIEARLRLGRVIPAQGMSRTELARLSRAEIQRLLGLEMEARVDEADANPAPVGN